MSSFKLQDNYIYFHHLDEFCVLPIFPEEISDSMTASFESTSALGRSAPIFSYSNSGPRSISFNFLLHRDLMSDINTNGSNFILDDSEDIVEKLIRTIESAALPRYQYSTRAINPPMVSIKIGEEVYIKGVINGSVSKTFSGPLLASKKYAVCEISFTVSEVDPYDAISSKTLGGYRGLSKQVDRRVWR